MTTSAARTPANASDCQTAALIEFIDRHRRLFVLTGAGCSTDSGIPDYRDADGEWKRGRPVMLKPDVVFFGEGVPGDRVRRAMAAVDASDAMLIVGSSLMVYSGYRFAKAMADLGKPIAAVNLGRTRADDVLTLKVENRCADALSFLLT